MRRDGGDYSRVAVGACLLVPLRSYKERNDGTYDVCVINCGSKGRYGKGNKHRLLGYLGTQIKKGCLWGGTAHGAWKNDAMASL